MMIFSVSLSVEPHQSPPPRSEVEDTQRPVPGQPERQREPLATLPGMLVKQHLQMSQGFHRLRMMMLVISITMHQQLEALQEHLTA